VGLSAVNPKVWALILAVFVLAFVFRRLRVRWVQRRRRLAERLAAALRQRSARGTGP
jgi:uncharacterized membrane protein